MDKPDIISKVVKDPNVQQALKRIMELGTENTKNIQDNIKFFRKKKTMNQATLADVAGLDQTSISRIELGKHKFIKNTHLEKIAAALEVRVEDIVSSKAIDPNDNDDIKYINNIYLQSSDEDRKMIKEFVTFIEFRGRWNK